jgi:uncharacterized membrane protein
MSGFPWRALLFVSAALNLLVVGAVAGAYGAGVRRERQSAQAVVARRPGPRAFMAALPPPTRAKMRQELAASWERSRELRHAAVEARRDAFATAASEPYDATRVKAAFARLRAADQAAIGVFHDNVADAFARLTPAERREALDALRRATPAARARIAPANDAAAAPGQSADDRHLTPREQRRERWLERRRQRLEQQQQQQQEDPAP